VDSFQQFLIFTENNKSAMLLSFKY